MKIEPPPIHSAYLPCPNDSVKMALSLVRYNTETADSAGFWTDWDAKLANQRQVLNLHPESATRADSAKLRISLAHSPHQLTWQQSYPACLLFSRFAKLLRAKQSTHSSTSTKLLPTETSDREPTPKHQQSYSP
jgi:hypothetical protein